jgi:hypothetical protein
MYDPISLARVVRLPQAAKEGPSAILQNGGLVITSGVDA